MTVLVTGGTGVLGREVVRRLTERGADVRILSRKPGAEPGHVQGDLETGDGLAAAVSGVDAIVGCATSADMRRPYRDVIQTSNLLAAARESGTRPHIVYISIVGVDRMRFPYYRVKRACERLVESSGLPWTIQRATQFHDLILMLSMTLSKLPVALVPRGIRSQPVDAGEVADRLAEFALGEPAGHATDIGGPRAELLEDMARTYLAATGRRKRVVGVPLFGKAAGEFRAGMHLLGPGGIIGRRTFDEYLRDRLSPEGSVAAPYSLRR